MRTVFLALAAASALTTEAHAQASQPAPTPPAARVEYLVGQWRVLAEDPATGR